MIKKIVIISLLVCGAGLIEASARKPKKTPDTSISNNLATDRATVDPTPEASARAATASDDEEENCCDRCCDQYGCYCLMGIITCLTDCFSC